MKEEKEDYGMERIGAFVSLENRKAVKHIIAKLMEEAQNDGFIKGYEYAITILKESRGKKR